MWKRNPYRNPLWFFYKHAFGFNNGGRYLNFRYNRGENVDMRFYLYFLGLRFSVRPKMSMPSDQDINSEMVKVIERWEARRKKEEV